MKRVAADHSSSSVRELREKNKNYIGLSHPLTLKKKKKSHPCGYIFISYHDKANTKKEFNYIDEMMEVLGRK